METGETIIHEGKVYEVVERDAKVGDVVVVVTDCDNHNWPIGVIGTVMEVLNPVEKALDMMKGMGIFGAIGIPEDEIFKIVSGEAGIKKIGETVLVKSETETKIKGRFDQYLHREDYKVLEEVKITENWFTC